MLKIKLARFGRKHQPHFRIVVNEARDKRDGQYVALVGHYSPATQPKSLDVDMEAYQAWIVKGAQPTETVASLIKRYQTGTPFPPKKPSLSKKAKAKAAAAKEAASKPAEVVATPAPAATPETETVATETVAPKSEAPVTETATK